jgi:hypothetical protein
VAWICFQNRQRCRRYVLKPLHPNMLGVPIKNPDATKNMLSTNWLIVCNQSTSHFRNEMVTISDYYSRCQNTVRNRITHLAGGFCSCLALFTSSLVLIEVEISALRVG